MADWFRNLETGKKIGIIVGSIILVGIIITLIIIFVPKYEGPGENCTFIGESANLHDEYIIRVDSVTEYDEIEIIKNDGDTEKSVLIGDDSHYIAVTITIIRDNVADPKEDHEFDKNDFKLKDHTGIQIKNVNFTSIADGSVLSFTDFSTKTAIEDFSWIGETINTGEQKQIIIYFEIDKDISYNNTVMVLETDLFLGAGSNLGKDIVLTNKEE